MKLLVDATNIKFGGGLQVAVSVIREMNTVNTVGLDITFAVNENIARQLELEDIDNLHVINSSIKTLNPFSESNKRLILLASDVDIVFTVFGPPFWRSSKATHLVGFANAWVVSKASLAYRKLGLLERLATKIKNYILAKLLYDKKRFYITETETIKNRFVSKFKSERDRIIVIPNTLPYIYTEEVVPKYDLVPKQFIKSFKLVSVAHNYPHKNLEIISKVGKKLELAGFDFVFIVTINKEQYNNMSHDFQRYTYNVGPIDIKECFNLYQQVDALFLPTLLECFSVSYLEAMYHGLPILTSDLDFAHDTCKDAAIYFDPLSPTDITNKISMLLNNEQLVNSLTEAGRRIIKLHPINADKVDMYLKFINHIAFI